MIEIDSSSLEAKRIIHLLSAFTYYACLEHRR